MSRPWILVFVLPIAACAFDTTMDLAHFNTSCATAADCTLVFATACGCSCEEVAINVADREVYEAERYDKFTHCDEQLTCQACPGNAHTAVCEHNVCAVK